MKALLVYPRFPFTYWGFQYGLRIIGKQAALPPLGLLTVAALLPADWKLRLVDLNVDALHDDDLRWADVVLTGGLLVQTPSLREIIARAVCREIPVVVGGPAPTASPDLFPDAELMRWLYSPREYYARCEAYLERVGPISEPRSSTLGEIGSLLRTIWRVGILGSHRRFFWRLMAKALSRDRCYVRQAVAHVVQGEHLISYTRDHLLPRMERSRAEVGIEDGPYPLAETPPIVGLELSGGRR